MKGPCRIFGLSEVRSRSVLVRRCGGERLVSWAKLWQMLKVSTRNSHLPCRVRVLDVTGRRNNGSLIIRIFDDE